MTNKNGYLDDWKSLFLNHRPYLVSFAFRMTGSLAEAEDLAQETYLECANVDPATIQNHKSWLTKVCSNKGLDLLKSASHRRENYKGPWLPDAIPDSYGIWSAEIEGTSPDKNILLSESLTTSFLLLLEKLAPEERVVYLLNEIFDYSFKEISSFLGKSEEACRKIAQRARESVLKDRPRFDVGSENAMKTIVGFFEAARAGDQNTLQSLLAEDSEFWSDGGGKVSAALRVLTESEQIAKFWTNVVRAPFTNNAEYKAEYAVVNSRPGYIISRRQGVGDWLFDTVMTFEFKDGKIARIFAQRNPDKLESLTRI